MTTVLLALAAVVASAQPPALEPALNAPRVPFTANKLVYGWHGDKSEAVELRVHFSPPNRWRHDGASLRELLRKNFSGLPEIEWVFSRTASASRSASNKEETSSAFTLLRDPTPIKFLREIIHNWVRTRHMHITQPRSVEKSLGSVEGRAERENLLISPRESVKQVELCAYAKFEPIATKLIRWHASCFAVFTHAE